MPSAKVYKEKLEQLNPDRENVHPTTVQQAQEAIAKIEKIELFLLEIHKRLLLEAKRVDSNYQQALKTASLTGPAMWLGTRETITHKRALKHKFQQKRKEILAAYLEIEAMREKRLAAFRTKKQQLFSFIEHELGQKPKTTTSSLGGLIVKTLPTPEAEEPNYKKYLRSAEWKKKAEAAKVRAGNRCQTCNRPRSEVQLEAHHRTYERIGRELPGDITVLCRSCHQSVEESKAKVSLESRQVEMGHGFCISCGGQISLNQHRPLCPECYKIWSSNGKSYSSSTKFCHVCGKEHQTSVARPMCLDCYKDIKLLSAS